MAFTTPGTAVAGEVLTAAFWNEQVRDNSAYLKAEADAVGLTHIATQTFSAITTVSVNNVFTADFTHYRIIVTVTGSGAAENFVMRFRASGSDNTASTYNYQFMDSSGASVIANRVTNSTNMLVGVSDTAAGESFVIADIVSPQIAQRTGVFSNAFSPYLSSFVRITGGYFNNTTQFDGFSLFPGTASGTIAGTIYVYGYNKG